MSNNSSKKSHSKKQLNSSIDSSQLQEIKRRPCHRGQDKCSRSSKNLKVCNICVKGEASFKGNVEIEGQLTVNGTINGPVSTCELLTKQISINPLCPSCPSDPSDPNNNTIFINAKVAAVPFNIFGENHYSVLKADQCLGESLDITLVIAPKGTGAFVTTEPNETVTGGNSRGAFATDLQRDRKLATQVASGENSVIGGGESNTAEGIDSTVAGGAINIASETGTTIGGGILNIASGGGSIIGGGLLNTASGISSTIGGGSQNTSLNQASTIAGGNINTASGTFSTIGGGNTNTASGSCSTIPGGCNNAASGVNSFATGTNAGGLHDNTFVYGGSPGPTITTAANQAIFNLGLIPGPYAPVGANTLFINGNLSVTGIKSFVINHPILEDKFLRHICLEAPRADLMYRGTVQLVNGRADVDIDETSKMTNGTFTALTKNANAYLTNRSNPNWDLTQIEDHDILSTGKFAIISNNKKSNILVNWFVIAERKLEDEILIEVNKPKIIPEIHNNTSNIETDEDLLKKITIPELKYLLIRDGLAKVEDLLDYSILKERKSLLI